MDSQLSQSPASSSISLKYFDANTMDTFLSETSSINSNKDRNSHNDDDSDSRISVIKNDTKVKLNFSVERILSNDCIKTSEQLCVAHNLPCVSCSECLTNNLRVWKVEDTPPSSTSPTPGAATNLLPFNIKSFYRPIPRYPRAPAPGIIN